MRAFAVVLLLSIAACGRGHRIYAGSDIANAGSAAVLPQTPRAGSAAEPPVNPPPEEPIRDSGPRSLRDAAVARDAAVSAADAGTTEAPDAAPTGDAGGVCAAGRGDCDGDAANGCEQDLESSLEHCGACGRVCHAEGARATSASCVSGTCRLTCQFAPVFGDCDGDPENGCEIDLWHDPNNCSVCGMRCSRCADGTCL